jgi:hypothetical protein
LTASSYEDVSPNSKARRNEMAKRVSSGINNAKIHIVDLCATFEGQQKQQFVATAAVGASSVNPKVQYAVFFNRNSAQHGNDQVNVAATVFKSDLTSLNFLQALETEVKMNFNADIKYGKSGNGNVQVQGYAERTKERAEELKTHPLTKRCVEDIQKNNLYQYACHKLIVKAHTPNYIRASVNYKEVSPAFRNMTYQAFRLIDHVGYWFIDVNPLKVAPEGKIEIESRFDYPEKTMDLAISTKLGAVHFNNVRIPKVTATALSLYSPFNPIERVMNYYTRQQYRRKYFNYISRKNSEIFCANKSNFTR